MSDLKGAALKRTFLHRYNLTYTCRVCLRKCTKIHPLEGLVLNTNVSISGMISYCTNEDVILDENLPRGVCFECFRTIQIAYSFIVKFKENNRRLLKQRCTSSTEINQEEIDSSLECKPEPVSCINEDLLEKPSTSHSPVPENPIKEIHIQTTNMKIGKTEANSQKDENAYNEVTIKLEPVDVIPNNCEIQVVLENSVDPLYVPEKIYIKCDNDSEQGNNQSSFNEIQTIVNKPPDKHTCPICSKVFIDFRRGLIRHLRSHHKYDHFKCDSCISGPKYTIDLYVQHYNKSHLYRCPVCNVKCGSKGGFWYHKKKCFDAEAKSKDTSSLNKVPLQHICIICSKAFGSFNRGLIKHLRHTHQNCTFKCNKCPLEIDLNVDLYVKHYNEAHLYECPKCNRKLESKGGFYYHVKKCSSNGKPTTSEIEPENRTINEKEPENQVESVNENITKPVANSPKKVSIQKKFFIPYTCPLCSRRFTDFNKGGGRHLHVHHSNDLLKCDKCTMNELPLDLYIQHYKTHLYHCSICEKKLGSRNTFYMHMKNHVESSTWQCPHENCNKSFLNHFRLRKHLATHSPSTTRYICSRCGKKFSTYDTFRYHIKTHDGKRNYLCSVCGRSFIQSVHLKDHMWHHTGMKQFHCQDCDKSYTSVTQLKKHRRKYCGAEKLIKD